MVHLRLFRICKLYNLRGGVESKNLDFLLSRISSGFLSQARFLKTVKNGASSEHPKGHHENFTLIYKFPNIRLVAGFSKFKLIQTAFFMAISPVCYASYFSGEMSLAYANGITGVAAFATASLLYFSYVTRRFVGYMWLDDTRTQLKIAYLTFWANRKDVTVPIESVQLFDDPNQNYTKPLLKLNLLDSKDFYFLSIRYGQIYDKKLFRSVFGILPVRAYDEFKSYKSKRDYGGK